MSNFLPDAPDVDIDLDRLITSPHRARDAIRELVVRGGGNEAFCHDAMLATSELVTAALTGDGGACQLSAWYSAMSGWLRIEVMERSHAMPSAQAVEHDLDDDRLAVLVSVPAVWGAEQTLFGRIVWIELQADSPTVADSDLAAPGALER
jgi:hypothetical protein